MANVKELKIRCPIPKCQFELVADITAGEAECVEFTSAFHRHLASHTVDELAISLFVHIVEKDKPDR